ncbi:MAG: FAD-dependent oxidoreductase, partial [Longimicrobiales bacterium]|nr:FAD-dependent oxidoreductase [Longimicrobiales bacterium]
LQAEAGYESRILVPAEVRELEPAIGPDIVLGLATDYDHQLDAARLTRALWLAAEHAGVDARPDAPAAGVVTADGAVRGVRLESGAVVDADAVVVAAGAWSGRLDLPLPLPVRPVRGQIVVLRTPSPVLSRTTWGPHLYLVPRQDGRLVVGSTMEEVGFAPRITAGAVARLLGLAARVVPELAEAAVEGFRVGLRPAAEDGLPVIGPDPAVQRLFYATGHFRNGILLAPETAERIAAMVLDGAAPEPAFDPGRFAR